MACKTKLRSCRIKCILIILLICYAIWKRSTPKAKIQSKNLQVVVHLDFKGSPVKLAYLSRLLPKLRGLGATGLLLEYEDMFPYGEDLVNISAMNRYEKPELKSFIQLAVHSGFEVIPLVQTFGHLEHVLKMSSFQQLREDPFYPDSICPSNVNSLVLLQDMLQQVIKFHTAIHPLKYIHIGCDEVYHINECDRCRSRKMQRHDIFINHVSALTKIIANMAPATRVLIWDDMLRDIHIQDIKLDVTPVCWDYSPSIAVTHTDLMRYHRKFQKIWIASAFKGADGRTNTFPDVLKRLYNNYEWMSLIGGYKDKKAQFEGIILTGWSRYSHMDPPCDLIQVSVPSLILNLLFIKWSTKTEMDVDLNEIYTEHIHKDLMEELRCSELINLEYFDGKQCDFDGSYLYEVLSKNDEFINDVTNYINDESNGLKSVKYYSKFSYVNRHIAVDNIKWCNTTIVELLTIESEIRKVMSEYYDDYFIEEYVNFKLYDTKAMLLDLLENLKYISYVRSWDRRPFTY